MVGGPLNLGPGAGASPRPPTVYPKTHARAHINAHDKLAGVNETPATEIGTESALEPTPDEILHYYATYVSVPARADCPHGNGPTIRDSTGHGVRIACPQGRDCWFVFWRFEAP